MGGESKERNNMIGFAVFLSVMCGLWLGFVWDD